MDDENGYIPDGAAVFPTIPAELGVSPLLLTLIHLTVFIAGSDEKIVNADAGAEALEQAAEYVRRLESTQRQRLREEMSCLVSYARAQKWPKQSIRAVADLLSGFGLNDEGE